ncbi:MAG: hypothetical protein IID08_07295 [Candidatus Hydrogenedentes bacterium]|nr:hypothetical protein [Candidatus Hydrogenedentota bacterium]
MSTNLDRYLEKRADLARWPLHAGNVQGLDTVVIVPVYAERETLPATLDSLACNLQTNLDTTLILCVVNNTVQSAPDAVRENADTLARLDQAVTGDSPWPALRMGYLDASSPGNELPEGEGVGTARKLGMDWAVSVFRDAAMAAGVLISLDADTRVETGYLSTIKAHFQISDTWAAVVDYAHPIDGTPEQQEAILAYELYLRYHVLGLQHAGSRYAFHTIGSTIACTAQAYVAVSGMNRRTAGEDFYFLQELAKTGRVDRIRGTVVHPSPRPSDRVPFGTGPKVNTFMEDPESAYTVYHPEVYTILQKWLALAGSGFHTPPNQLLDAAREIAPELGQFLEQERFVEVIEKLRDHAPDDATFLRQFHRWFDALKTLRLIHHLRDTSHPSQDLFRSIETLLHETDRTEKAATDMDDRPDPAARRALLERLRTLA